MYFTDWPEELKSGITGLFNVEGKWLQFKLKGVDNLGIWLENPYWGVTPTNDERNDNDLQEQRDVLPWRASVLVRWQHIATIIYLEGQKRDDIPLGFGRQPMQRG